jgi:nitroreductase
MDAWEALTTRASAVKLGEPAPENHALEKILSAAVRALDNGRLRPWRFLIVRGEARKILGDVLAEALKTREPGSTERRLEAERLKPLRAPMLIVVVATLRDNPKIPDIEQIVAVGAAAQNLLVATHALGFGGFWRTGESAYDPHVKQALGLRARDHIVGFLYLGTITQPGVARAPELDEVVSAWPS